MSYLFVNTSNIVRDIIEESTPTPREVLPCGSKSISKTERFNLTKEDERLIAVVVFATPPFWFAIAIIRAVLSLPLLKIFYNESNKIIMASF